jgi:hypothetical protein
MVAQGLELIEHHLEGNAHGSWKRCDILLVGYDFNQLGQTVTTLLGNEPEFGKMRSERIDQLGALADQESASAVNGKRCLLLRILDRHEPL